ncbi:MAG: stage III sporulation protein AD [Lachnospiraceae bacterium]|nr:stage III sporulation protein AD [Lachnospiraceae bacterium]
MIKIVLTGVITAVLVLILKEQQKGISAVVLMAGSLAILLFCMEYLETILELFDSISDMMKVDKIYIKILLKIIGISYICQFASEICKDLGSQTVGKQIEMAGKLSVLVVSIPVIQGLLDTMKELLAL